jgi:hypothetical protein
MLCRRAYAMCIHVAAALEPPKELEKMALNLVSTRGYSQPRHRRSEFFHRQGPLATSTALNAPLWTHSVSCSHSAVPVVDARAGGAKWPLWVVPLSDRFSAIIKAAVLLHLAPAYAGKGRLKTTKTNRSGAGNFIAHLADHVPRRHRSKTNDFVYCVCHT